MTIVAERQSNRELPERWSAKVTTDVVERLLRGEAADVVSQQVQMPNCQY